MSDKQNQTKKNNNAFAEIKELGSKAKQELSPEDLAEIYSSELTEDFTLQDCELHTKVFKRAAEKLEEKTKQFNNLREQEHKLESLKQELELKTEEFNHKKSELEIREDDIKQRELDAESGFVQQRELILSEIAQKEQEIEDLQKQIAEERKQLRLEQKRLETEKEIFAEDKQALDEKIEQKAAIEVDKLNVKIQILEEQLKFAQNQRNQFQSVIIKRQESDRRFGQKTPEEILEQLENLQREKRELEEKLASRPSETATARLQELESQKETWEDDRFRLNTRLQELERNSSYSRIAVTELETLRDEKEALEASNTRLKAALQQLRADVDDAIGKDNRKSPFPKCFDMDNNVRLQTENYLSENNLNLKDFAEDLRVRIALSPLSQDSKTQKRLFYSAQDIRAFLGGLAMSHLHILQGISGTGKTSLPVAFTRAINGNYKLVEVQAGWRDHQDLIGYFNAFERTFYENKFFQAIYEAQCPANKDRIYIVILDEMNLSRPEQYFAYFLSQLEQDNPTIDVTTDLDKPSPILFANKNTLPIPPNIWFVGTANQDETTLEFADKTYDRAHIMELQRHRESFDLPEKLEYREPEPISHQSLITAFEKAQNQYTTQADQVYKFLNDTLADFMERRFKVAWGNRLQRQINDFVPVVIATGGTIGEATDHILATKIFRKICDRHDTLSSDLKKLQQLLNDNWLDPSTPPEKSLSIIDKEIHRLEPIED
jgi:hypothetical protein